MVNPNEDTEEIAPGTIVAGFLNMEIGNLSELEMALIATLPADPDTLALVEKMMAWAYSQGMESK